MGVCFANTICQALQPAEQELIAVVWLCEEEMTDLLSHT